MNHNLLIILANAMALAIFAYGWYHYLKSSSKHERDDRPQP